MTAVRCLFRANRCPSDPVPAHLANMSHVHVDTPAAAGPLEQALARSPRFALDCEAAGFHRYENRLCLLQITVEETTYVVDPLSVDAGALLGEVLEAREPAVVMHGADFDLRLLADALGLRVRGLFDTQIAAALLGEVSLGLAAQLEERFGVRLSKKYQRADWAKRPLTPDMLEYAANDTRYLLQLADQLTRALEERGRLSWVEQECLALEEVGEEAMKPVAPEDPVRRVKGARDLSIRQVAALREALEWRDEIARRKDRAVFRVVGDKPLLDAVAHHPKRVDELAAIHGFPPALAHAEGHALVERLAAVARAPEAELRPYPRSERTRRPPPEVEELAERLKGVRNRKASEIGLPRGTLLANAVLQELAARAPADEEALGEIEGMRPWRVELLGSELLREIRRG